MRVTDNVYLDTQGFSVILYHSAFYRTFLAQKNTAMELILHGQRVSTNGDVRLLHTHRDRLDSLFRFIASSKIYNNLGNLLFAQRQPK